MPYGITNLMRMKKCSVVRVYKCLDIDAKRGLFQRRLQKYYQRTNDNGREEKSKALKKMKGITYIFENWAQQMLDLIVV